MGKGRRHRGLPLGNRSVTAIDRYMRQRRTHPCADSPDLWLGKKGPMTAGGVAQMMRRRGKQAGVDALHPHQFRHPFAHRWLKSEGTEGDLIACSCRFSTGHGLEWVERREERRRSASYGGFHA